jgi:uncharacterized protein YndB with AHSA1/START domain
MAEPSDHPDDRDLAPPDDVWAALTEPERIAEWFTEASPLAASVTSIDSTSATAAWSRGLTQIEPGQRFAHTWVWADPEPSPETLVSWSVEPIGTGGSRITLTHAGWDEAGVDEATRDDHEAYWSGYLDDLEAILAGLD